MCGCWMSCVPDGRGEHTRLIEFVADRPGHDRRYAIDATKLERELGWRAGGRDLRPGCGRRWSGIWRIAEWVESVTSGAYRNWIETELWDAARPWASEAGKGGGR